MIQEVGKFAVLPQADFVHIGLLESGYGYLGTMAFLTERLSSSKLKPAGFSTVPCSDGNHISIAFAWNGVKAEELAFYLT